MTEKRSGVAHYEDVDQDYLKNRKLKKSAGWILLWAMGVGAVISGDYSGWNGGLNEGGFWGLAIATALMAVMYTCMVFTIAELSAAFPHAGGFFSFTRSAFGPTGGFICGLTDAIEYILTPAVIVFFIGGYMKELFPSINPMVWWFVYYAFFVAINIYGVELTLKVSLVVTAIAAGVLFFFYGSVLFSGEFSTDKLFNIPPVEGHSANGLPFGWYGVFSAIPFGIWFFLAIEQLPLAAEETHNVARDMPKALIWGIMTLLLLAFCTLILNTGTGGGAIAIGKSNAPLADGFKSVFGTGGTANLLIVISLTGLIASFHAIVFAYGRVLFALSRAGYIPRWISLTGKNHTPYVALIVGALIGLACTILINYIGENTAVGAALLNMAVFGAVLSYIMVMFSYIKIRLTRPTLARPYKSPLGIPGALVGAVLSIVAVCATLANKDYRTAVMGVAIFVFVGILYFIFYSRYHLVAQSPEEEEALLLEAENELSQSTQ